MASGGLLCPIRRHPVVDDARGMALVGESDAVGQEDVEDRHSDRSECLELAIDRRFVVRREALEHTPDRRAREARHDARAQIARRDGGPLHRLDAPRAPAFRAAATIQMTRRRPNAGRDWGRTSAGRPARCRLQTPPDCAVRASPAAAGGTPGSPPPGIRPSDLAGRQVPDGPGSRPPPSRSRREACPPTARCGA